MGRERHTAVTFIRISSHHHNALLLCKEIATVAFKCGRHNSRSSSQHCHNSQSPLAPRSFQTNYSPDLSCSVGCPLFSKFQILLRTFNLARHPHQDTRARALGYRIKCTVLVHCTVLLCRRTCPSDRRHTQRCTQDTQARVRKRTLLVS